MLRRILLGTGAALALLFVPAMASAEKQCTPPQEIFDTVEECTAGHHMCAVTGDGRWARVRVYASDEVMMTSSDDDSGWNLARPDRIVSLCPACLPANWSGTPTSPLVAVNRTHVVFPDVQPTIDPVTRRTLVPVRPIAEALGAQVTWDEANQEVTLQQEGHEVRLVIGQDVATVDGATVTLDQPARVMNDRTMVPLRFVSEAFDAQIDWVGGTAPFEGWPGRYQIWIWTGDWVTSEPYEHLKTDPWFQESFLQRGGDLTVTMTAPTSVTGDYTDSECRTHYGSIRLEFTFYNNSDQTARVPWVLYRDGKIVHSGTEWILPWSKEPAFYEVQGYDTEPGRTTTFRVVVDPNNLIYEENETNNEQSATVQIIAR